MGARRRRKHVSTPRLTKDWCCHSIDRLRRRRERSFTCRVQGLWDVGASTAGLSPAANSRERSESRAASADMPWLRGRPHSSNHDRWQVESSLLIYSKESTISISNN